MEVGHKREVQLLNNQIEQLQDHVENLNKNLNKALDITALLEDKREGQGAKESELDTKFKNMEKMIEGLRTQNDNLIKKDEERQKRLEERRKQREIEALIEKEKNKSWFKRLLG